jgi:homoserine kinase type II
MADLIRLDDDDVGVLAGAFGLGEPTGWGVVDGGTINGNHWVEADGRRWFLRVNEGKEEADVRWEAALVAELAAAGVPTPPPVAAAGGQPLVRHRERWISLFPWMAGEHRGEADVSAADAHALGAALAALHRAGAPLAARMARPGIYTTAHMVARVRGLAADPAAAADPALVGPLAAVADELAWLGGRAGERAAAPAGLIHGDLFCDNVLFDGARLVALLDFEQASSGTWVYDLAVCLNAWCFSGSLEPTLVAALVDGYRSVRELEPIEYPLLYVEARAAAMRFTITRITDVYLPGAAMPGKDFREFLGRLEAWRAMDAADLLRMIGRDRSA